MKLPAAPAEAAPEPPPVEAAAVEQRPAKAKASGIVNRRKTVFNPTSFRLTEEDKATLQQIADKVNAESRGRVSRDKVMQALIHLGEEMPASKIIKALREMI